MSQCSTWVPGKVALPLDRNSECKRPVRLGKLKRCLLLGREAMINLDSILKSRDITLPTKVCLVRAMVFPVVMYGCESWTIKKAEHWRIDAFELWCWRRLLRVPWTARRSNQSILKEISPGCSLQGLMLKLELQDLGPWCKELTHLKRPLCWQRLRTGGEGDDREWDGWMASPTQWTWVWVDSGSWWWTGRPSVPMGSQRVGQDWETELTDYIDQKQLKCIITFRVICSYKIGDNKSPKTRTGHSVIIQ